LIATDDAFCGECGNRVDGQGPTAGEVNAVGQALPTPPQRPAQPTGQDGREPYRAPNDSAPRNIPPRPLDDNALLGEAAPNQQYLGARLTYVQGEAESLDPLSPRFFARLVMQAFIFATIFWIGLVILGAIFRTDGKVVYGLWVLVVGFAFWLSPIWTSVSEWKLMIDDKAAAYAAAFEHIAWVFRRRQTPVQKLSVKRISLGQASRDYLYAQDGIFRAYVACFPYGQDLYIGWTLWWRISPLGWCWTVFMRTWQTFTLRGSELHNIHRYDYGKALREAVHSAAREGVDAAVGKISFQGAGTIGSEISIEATGLSRRAPG
jgi:hypothetical protein